MKLNRTDAFWDRKTRNDLNENWDIIEGNTRKLEDDFKNVVNNITDDVVEQLVDNAKLNWKEPVPSQNNLPGNAQVGDTRMTRDTGKVYRFNGSAWVEIQQIDAGPVNEVDSRLTAQLAEVDDKAFYTGLTFNRVQKAVLTIVDDDGYPQVYDMLKPIAEQEGVPIATAVITSRIGTNPSSMTLKQLKECQAAGMEIVSHTHTHRRLSELSPEEQERDIRLAKEYLQKNGFNHDVLVYPFGAADETTQAITARYHQAGVYIDYGEHRLNNPPVLQYRLERVYYNDEAGNNYAQLCKDKIDEAIANNSWLIIGMHCFYKNFDPEGLREVIRYAKSRGIEIGTFKRALEIYGNIIDLPDFKIGADGRIRSNTVGVFQNLGFKPTNDTPITDFPVEKVTKVAINTADVVGFPIRDSCTLITYSFGTFHSFQELHSSLRDESYRRRWNGGVSGSWAEWYPINVRRVSSGFYATSPITAFPKDSIVETPLSSSLAQGSPEGVAGILITHRFSSDAYSFQEWKSINSNKLFNRTWNTANESWNPWRDLANTSRNYNFDYGTIPAHSCVKKMEIDSSRYTLDKFFRATVMRDLPLGIISDYTINNAGRAYFTLCNVTNADISVGSVGWREITIDI